MKGSALCSYFEHKHCRKTENVIVDTGNSLNFYQRKDSNMYQRLHLLAKRKTVNQRNNSKHSETIQFIFRSPEHSLSSSREQVFMQEIT